MGGEGSMAAANNSLKMNRSQISKRKDSKGFEGSYSSIEIKKFPKATPEQLINIQEKIKLENKVILRKQILFVALSILVLFLLFVFLK